MIASEKAEDVEEGEEEGGREGESVCRLGRTLAGAAFLDLLFQQMLAHVVWVKLCSRGPKPFLGDEAGWGHRSNNKFLLFQLDFLP